MRNVRVLEPQFERIFGDGWFGLLLLHSEVATIAGPYFDFGTIARAALQMTAAARRRALQGRSAAAFIERPGKVLYPLVPPPDISGPALAAVANRILDAER